MAVLLTVTATRPVSAQSTNPDSTLTTIILVRHAEKADDGTENPSLTEEGRARAQKLADMLDQAEVTAIFSTDYRRTRQTVLPLASRKNLTIQSYDPRSFEVLKSIMSNHTGKTVIVAGHSNTVPFIANRLTGRDRFQQLDDNNYHTLFIVTVTAIGKGKALRLSY